MRPDPDRPGTKPTSHSRVHLKLTPEVIAGCASPVASEASMRAANALEEICSSAVLAHCRQRGIRDQNLQKELVQHVWGEAFCFARARPSVEPAVFQRKLYRFAEQYVNSLRGHPASTQVHPLLSKGLARWLSPSGLQPDALVANRELCEKVVEVWTFALRRLAEAHPTHALYWMDFPILRYTTKALHYPPSWRQVKVLRQAMYETVRELKGRCPEGSLEANQLYMNLEALAEPDPKRGKRFWHFITGLLELLGSTYSREKGSRG